jgi:hypothetical protein
MKQHSSKTANRGRPDKPRFDLVVKGNAFYAPTPRRPVFARTMICRHGRYRTLCPECSPLR